MQHCTATFRWFFIQHVCFREESLVHVCLLLPTCTYNAILSRAQWPRQKSCSYSGFNFQPKRAPTQDNSMTIHFGIIDFPLAVSQWPCCNSRRLALYSTSDLFNRQSIAGQYVCFCARRNRKYRQLSLTKSHSVSGCSIGDTRVAKAINYTIYTRDKVTCVVTCVVTVIGVKSTITVTGTRTADSSSR